MFPAALAFALRFALLLALSAATMSSAFAQQGSVSTRLDAPSISIDEVATLTVTALDADGELDTTALEREFDIVGRATSRQVSVVNGEQALVIRWALELQPRAVGVFTVPAVRVGPYESELLTLEVTAPPSGAEREVFVEASVDEPTPWVQAQVILSVRVFLGIEIASGSLSEPAGDGLEVERLGDDREYLDRRDGRDYRVTEQRYALFAQRSGTLVVDPIRLQVEAVADPSRVRGFFSPVRQLSGRSEPVNLEVRPRPADGSGWWLPSSAVTLDGGFRGDPDAARVGEPLVRTIELRAAGVLATQLPDLPAPDIDGAAVYADDAERSTDTDADGLRSSLSASVAIIPQRPGELTIPELRVEWFDTAGGTARTATLAARSVTVVPGGSAVSGVPPATAISPDGSSSDAPNEGDDVASSGDTIVAPGDRDPASLAGRTGPAAAGEGRAGTGWRALALAAFAGWLITAALLVMQWSRGRGVREASRSGIESSEGGAQEAEARSDIRYLQGRLESACRDAVPGAIARAALARAAPHWPDAPPRSLRELGARLDVPDLDTSLERLDRALYRARADLADVDWRPFPESLASALARVAPLPDARTASGARGSGPGPGRRLRRRRPSRHGDDGPPFDLPTL